MVLVLNIMMTGVSIMEIGLIILRMDMGNIYLSEDKNILVILKMIKKKDLEYIICLNIHIILVFGKMENLKVLLNALLVMIIIIVIGKKIKKEKYLIFTILN